MKFDHPTPEQIPQLVQLWRDIFGEYDGFWELFLETAFQPDHCCCFLENGNITASLCWLDCESQNQRFAYLYAVMTHPDHRGKGLCRQLLDEVHAHLTSKDYSAALLVPAEESLRTMYRKLGYRDCTSVSEFSCTAGDASVVLRAIGPEEYARLRRAFLPENSVIQEGASLRFLAQQAQFYTGDDILLAAYTQEGTLHGMELLGNSAAVPGIVTALECKKGQFRTPGTDRPFAMFHPLAEDAVIPDYFGFAFD